MRFAKSILLILPIVLLSVGCVSTSKVYQLGIKSPVDNAVSEMRDYNAAFQWGTDADNLSKQTTEKASIDALETSVADTSNISAAVVNDKWQAVEPRYRWYIYNDPKLKNPDDLKLRLGLPDLISSTNAKELGRQAAAQVGWLTP